MTTYLVGAEDEGLGAVEVEADDFEEAAESAMTEWEEGGSFAGDPFPGELQVTVVHAATHETKKVKITVDWEPVYYAHIMEDE